MGYFDKADFDVVKYVMDLNFMAPMHLTKLVAKKMKEHNTKGLISVVSSIASGGMLRHRYKTLVRRALLTQFSDDNSISH